MKELKDRYIRFDWAIKRLLQQKANFGVLEGFLTVFLGEKITIVELLESEGNQLSEDDKFNWVDIKALNDKGEIIIVEIQNTRELYYLERILYGVAKAITEHISLGELQGQENILNQRTLLRHRTGRGLPLSRAESLHRRTHQGSVGDQYEREERDCFPATFRDFPRIHTYTGQRVR
jgi:hypothetical protein